MLASMKKYYEYLIMTGLLFSPSISKSAIEEKIHAAQNLLININMRQKAEFLLQLAARISDFETELLSEQLSPDEQVHVLAQYERFAKTLYNCMVHPERASLLIKYYHKTNYYPVGIHDTQKPSPTIQTMAMGAVAVGIALLAGTIPAFIFNPAIGSIMLSLAITLLFPSGFYLMTPESPDTAKKKDEEKNLFELGAKLINPELVFDEEVDFYAKETRVLAY